MMAQKRKVAVAVGLGAALLAAAVLLWQQLQPTGLGDGFASGNGRIEATEVDVAAKLAGRLAEVLVDEGDFVEAGQVLARMDTLVLEAQLSQARAQMRQAENAIRTADAQVALRRSEKITAEVPISVAISGSRLSRGHATSWTITATMTKLRSASESRTTRADSRMEARAVPVGAARTGANSASGSA